MCMGGVHAAWAGCMLRGWVMAVVRIQVALFVLLAAAAVCFEQQPGDGESQYGILLSWVEDLGGELSGASMQLVPGMGVGVVAQVNLKAGVIVSRTPLSAVINIEHALASEQFGPLADELEHLSSTNLKALFVAYERHRGDSYWQPYLSALPTETHTTLFFSEEELSQFQASLVKDFVTKQQAAASKAYDEIWTTLARYPDFFPTFTRKDLLWGISVWTSRAHRVRVLDQEGHWQMASCLVPVADMLNMAVAEGGSNVVCDTNEASTHFECSTTKPVAAGTQLLVEYALHPAMRHNGRLLMHYGFVARGNPYNSVSIKPPKISTNLPNFSARTKVAEQLPIFRQLFFQLSRPDAANPTVMELVRAMRLMVGSTSEINKAANSPQPLSEALSNEVEKKALRKAVDYLQNILSAYTTTPEEDEALLLQGARLSVNAQNAVTLRLEEKLLLRGNMDYLQWLLGNLSGSSRRTEL